MSTVPVPAGATAVREVSELTRNEEAAVPPKSTAVTLSKLVPERVTCVPPLSGPPAGLAVVVTPVTVGVLT